MSDVTEHRGKFHPDDILQPFQIEAPGLRGRLVRLGGAVDTILKRHDYPLPVAALLAEALALAATLSAALKYEGIFTLQLKGDGPVGMLVTAILVANNYRDIDTDRAAGKRTIEVMMGRERSRLLFAILVYGAYPLIVLFATAGWTPTATLFAGFLAPFAVVPVRIVYAKTEGLALIRALKLTAQLHLWTGLVLAAGAALTF